MDRTEEQKLAQAPIEVILGGKKYGIKPLVIRDSRKWRSDVAEALGVLPKFAKLTVDDPESLKDGLNAMLAENPDTVIDLFFMYAKDLDKDEIEGIATESEIAVAFGQIVEVAFPLATSLVEMMTNISR